MTDSQHDLNLIADLENRLYRGLEGSDSSILKDVLSDDLLYVHSQGIDEDKIGNLIGQDSRLYWHGPVKRVTGETKLYGSDLATTVGHLEMIDYAHGPAYTLYLHQTLVWVKESVGWRLALRMANREHN